MNHKVVVVGKARKYLDVIRAIVRYEHTKTDKLTDNSK